MQHGVDDSKTATSFDEITAIKIEAIFYKNIN